MMSQTHTLIALAAFGKKGDSKRNWAVFIGSIIPDAFIYICWAWLTFIKGESQGRIWNEIYFAPPMQTTASIFNSILIYTALAILGWAYRKALWAKLIMFFAFAALIHIAFDAPVHNDDAYAYFWPFSDWKYISKYSYWDVKHHAGIVSIIEALIGFGAIDILRRRFSKRWVQILLIILVMSYAAILISRIQAGLAH